MLNTLKTIAAASPIPIVFLLEKVGVIKNMKNSEYKNQYGGRGDINNVFTSEACGVLFTNPDRPDFIIHVAAENTKYGIPNAIALFIISFNYFICYFIIILFL